MFSSTRTGPWSEFQEANGGPAVSPGTVVLLGLACTLSGCSILFSASEGSGKGVTVDLQSSVASTVQDTRLVVSNVGTGGPDRVILVQVGWCLSQLAEPPVSVQCGPIELVRIGREAPSPTCGVEVWAGYSADQLSNAECLIETEGSVNDIGAIIASFDNASRDLEYQVQGGTNLEPALLEIPWSSDTSYLVAFGLSFPEASVTATEGSSLLREFTSPSGDQFWSVGRPGTIEPDSVLGVRSESTWDENHVLMVEITAR